MNDQNSNVQNQFWSFGHLLIWISFVIWILSFVIPAEAANFAKTTAPSQQAPLPPPGPALKAGEKLRFDVYWLGMRVGSGTLETDTAVRDGRECFVVTARAETNEVLSKIYPVRDEASSWIDPSDGKSLGFSKTLREGRYRAQERIVYDYKNRLGRYDSLLNGSRKEFPIGPFCHDFISVFYWLKGQAVQVGDPPKKSITADERSYGVEFRVLERLWLEPRGLAPVDAIEVEPVTQFKGVLERRGRSWIYFTADAERRLCFVRFRTPLGPVTGVLKNDKVLG